MCNIICRLVCVVHGSFGIKIKKQTKENNTYTALDDAFCGAVVVELREFFLSVFALLLLLVFGTFSLIDFLDSLSLPVDSLSLPVEAFVFDCLESFDLSVEELSIITWPATEDNELFVCRPDDLVAFLDVLIVGDIFHLHLY